MKNAWTIARRDFRSYFTSPIAYIVIAVFLCVMGIMFLPTLFNYEQQSMRMSSMGQNISLTDAVIRPVYGNMNFVFLFIVPFITMRLFAEEKKMHTLELLMTSPVSICEIVTGKFLSTVLLFVTILATTLIYPLSLVVVGNPDLGPVLGAYTGLLFMGCSYAAVGILFSAMTENQIIAGALTFATLLILWIINWLGLISGPAVAEVLEQLSLINHYNNFSQGIFNTVDVVFYVSFIGFFLFLTHRVLDSYRWR